LCSIEIDDSCFELPIKNYCKAVLRMFDTYAFEFSTDDYIKNWGAFPKNDLEILRALYHGL